MKKIKLCILILLFINMITINVYGNAAENLSPEEKYVTYRNAVEKLIDKILQQSDLSQEDIILLTDLNNINTTQEEKMFAFEKAYEKSRDSILTSIKPEFKAEVENGYYHTYKNAIDMQISEILKEVKIFFENKEKSPEDEKKTKKNIEFSQTISKINLKNKSNKDKAEELKKLLPKYSSKDVSHLKTYVNNIIKKLENELPTPPLVSDLEEKNLIIGEYIIYMPSLTTDNMLTAKSTMAEDGKIYYKSEFLDGKWIEMNNVDELYQLMVDDKYKVLENPDVLNNIEYMAQIDKDGNLIEYREFKRYMDEITQSPPKTSDELVSDLHDQLSNAQNAYLENSISNMFAESRVLEYKLKDIEELFDSTGDKRLETVVKNLKKEIADGKNTLNKYDNSIKKLVDELINSGDTSPENTELIKKLETINGVSQSVKDERELKMQLQTALDKNDKLKADTIKFMLGMEVEDNSVNLQKIADEMRNSGLVNLASLVQKDSFTKEEINSPRSFDEQFANLIAAAILTSPYVDHALDTLSNDDIIEAIKANESKNEILLQNLKDASLDTIKNQCSQMIKDKKLLSQKLAGLSRAKNGLINEAQSLLKDEEWTDGDGTDKGENKENREKAAEIYTKLSDTDKSISDVKNQLAANDAVISKLKTQTYKVSDELNSAKITVSAIEDIKGEMEAVNLENKDYMLDIVDLMIKRYILVEEYKVEKDKEHSVSMSKLKDEISGLDYKINYILSLKILDDEKLDIEYHIKLSELLKDEQMKSKYMSKKNLFQAQKNEEQKNMQEIIDKIKKMLEIK